MRNQKEPKNLQELQERFEPKEARELRVLRARFEPCALARSVLGELVVY